MIYATYRDGATLAQEMLAFLEEAEYCGRYSLSPDDREETGAGPQDNIVLRHLHLLRGAGTADALEGFAAILSDFVAMVCEGSVPSIQYYDDKLDPSRATT